MARAAASYKEDAAGVPECVTPRQSVKRNFAGIWHGLSLASRGRISELKSTSAHRVRAVRKWYYPEMLRNCEDTDHTCCKIVQGEKYQ